MDASISEHNVEITQLKAHDFCFKIDPYLKEIIPWYFPNHTPQEIINMPFTFIHGRHYKVLEETNDKSTPMSKWTYNFMDYDQYQMDYVKKTSHVFSGICYITGYHVIDDNTLIIHGTCREHILTGIKFD